MMWRAEAAPDAIPHVAHFLHEHTAPADTGVPRNRRSWTNAWILVADQYGGNADNWHVLCSSGNGAFFLGSRKGEAAIQARRLENGETMDARVHPTPVGGTYVHVSQHDGETRLHGQPVAQFGHVIPSTGRGDADGIFARWQWDGTRLVVENGRYGFYPLFWCHAPDSGICVAPSLITLLERGASTEMDVEALAAFFRLGFFLGDDTPFSAIKVVPPNAVFEWRGGKLQCYGRYPTPAEPSTLSRDDAIDGYIELFRSAIAKRTPGSDGFAVPISGGRDSRHILLELHRTGFIGGACISVMDNPPDPNDDPKIGSILCRALGLEHTVINQHLSMFSAYVRKTHETHFCVMQPGWYLALADALSGRFDCAYDGIGGDVLSNGLFLDPTMDVAFHSRDIDSICRAVMRRHASMYAGPRRLLKGPLKPCLDFALARTRLAKEVARHLDYPNPVASFMFWNRTRRAIALTPYGLLTGISRVFAPYLDHNLFDFLTMLPSSMLLDRRFHDDTIARAYPRFAHIPYADKHAPQTDDSVTKAKFLAEAARAFLFKKPSRLMKNFIPRVRMLTAVTTLGRFKPWISPWIIYLDQLELILNASRETSKQKRTA